MFRRSSTKTPGLIPFQLTLAPRPSEDRRPLRSTVTSGAALTRRCVDFSRKGSAVSLYQSMSLNRLAIAAILVPLLTAAIATAQGGEEAGVRAAVGQYLRGHATGSGDEMRKAFLPTAHIEGMRGGAFVSWTVDEYVSRFTGKPAADEASRKRTIDAVDVSGTAAMARATLVHGATTFVDYFVLLKVDGQWKIANKVYTSAPTAR
jgi:hypothetical protein